jgi:hypothetical protein
MKDKLLFNTKVLTKKNKVMEENSTIGCEKVL